MLTHKAQRDLAEGFYKECLATFDKAQKEYTLQDNSFDNFERLAADLKLSREKVLWVYFKKHLDGILNHINGHEAQREPIEGRIMDAVVYLTLLYGMVKDNEGVPEPPEWAQKYDPAQHDPTHDHNSIGIRGMNVSPVSPHRFGA